MVAETVDRETGEITPAEFPELRLDRKFVINQQGKDHVLFAGLVDALHQLSGGFFSVDTRIEQLPTADNAQTAVCSARVQVFDPEAPDVVRRSASGIGDASPTNVSRMMANALIRMAETRAKARALRDLCNVGMVSFEELGAEEPAERPASAPQPAAPEGIVIEGRRFTRPQVEQAWRTRRAEAERLGIALPGDVATLVAEQAPLPILVGATQSLKRLVEATQAGQR